MSKHIQNNQKLKSPFSQSCPKREVANSPKTANVYAQVYRVVQGIPKGKVLTYGLISQMLNKRLSAQAVGWALRALTTSSQKQGSFALNSVPWHRVVGASGQLSTAKNPNIPPGLQQHLLEGEGIKFSPDGKLSLPKYLWLDNCAWQKIVNNILVGL